MGNSLVAGVFRGKGFYAMVQLVTVDVSVAGVGCSKVDADTTEFGVTVALFLVVDGSDVAIAVVSIVLKGAKGGSVGG